MRQALVQARRSEPSREVASKLEIIRAAARMDFPTDIPMYLVGSPHPHKTDSRRWLEELVSGQERLVTDAEVLQEISIARPDAIQPAFDASIGVVDEVFPVDREVVERVKGVVLGRIGLSARHAVHIAIMQIHGIKKILSFDRGFDGFPAITRPS